MKSVSFPFMLSPILGGVVAETLGYTTLFALGGLAAIANIAISARLVEPRSAGRLAADVAASPP
jgi:hypothetical protein